MGWRGTLIMVAALGGSTYLLWVSDRRSDSPALTQSVLGGRHLLDARRISLRREPGALPIVLERADAASFRIVEPVRDLAANARLTSIARVYDSAEATIAYEGEAMTERIVAETGLATPRAYLRAEFADGQRLEIEIGERGPLGHDVFARIGGRICRVQESLHSVLQINADEFREPFVFRNTDAQVLALRVDRKGRAGGREVLELRSRDGATFDLVQPRNVRLDQARAAQLIAGIVSLRAEGFVPGRPRDDAGPAAPTSIADAVIEVEGLAGTERVVLNSIEGGALLGHAESIDRDVWFTCDPVRYRSVLEVSLEQLRAHWLVGFPIDEAIELRLDPGSTSGIAFELRRRDLSEFRLVQPFPMACHPTAVAELIQAFRGLFAREFVDDDVRDLARYGLGEGRVSIRVAGGRSTVPVELHIGADVDDETTFCRRADEPVVATVPRGVAEVLRRPWTSYVSREVLRVDVLSLLGRIDVVGAAGTRAYERVDGRWRIAGVGDAPSTLADVVEDVLVDLDAREILADDAVAADALPRMAIALIDVHGNEMQTVELFRRDDETYFARVAARRVVYVLGARDGRDLWNLQN